MTWNSSCPAKPPPSVFIASRRPRQNHLTFRFRSDPNTSVALETLIASAIPAFGFDVAACASPDIPIAIPLDQLSFPKGWFLRR